jgi:YD repeat-containing protein
LALADFDADGYVDILAMTANRWNCSVVTGGPVPCLGNTLVVSGQDLNWAPGPKVFNQLHYRANAVDDGANILFAPENRRDFRRAAQQGTVTDPRLREGTTFTYRASDGNTSSNTATVYVKINPENSPPTITSVPPTGYLSTTPYTRPVYQLTATDPDPGDVVHYELVSTTHPFGVGPGAGVNLNPTTGAVDFYVGPCGSFGGPCVFSGDIVVVVAAIDSFGARDEQVMQLTISPYRATVPNVVGLLLQPAIDALLAASLRARVLLEIFDPAPAGTVLVQNPVAGTSNVPVGASVELTLSKGPEPTPTPTPSPTPDPNATPTPVPTAGPPLASIVVEPANPIVLVGDTQAFTATGVFADGTSADLTSQVTWQSSAQAKATIAAGGLASAIGAGPTTISATIDGITGLAELTVKARVPGDDTPPVAEITAPDADAEIFLPADVIGTASDANLLRWELEIAPAGSESFSSIAASGASVASGVLGRFDPTLLENGIYTLRLTVTDANDNVAIAERAVRAGGAAKVGVFSISFVDLAVPVSGIPIEIVRTYDSRFKGQGDFGIGWSLDVRRGSLRSNRPPGKSWQITSGALGLPCQTAFETATHLTEARLNDRESYRFQLVVHSPAPSIGGCFAQARFDFIDGSTPGATLEILGDTEVVYLNGTDEVLDSATFELFDPARVRLRTADGRVVDFDRGAGGITRVADANGNELAIGAAGVTHSTGKAIAFGRDAAGRITSVTDPMGHVLRYAYDANGDLNEIVDQVGSLTSYLYDRRHDLLEIRDPLGNRSVLTEYDDAGRAIAFIDGRGRRTELVHDLAGRQELVTNALGIPTRLVYDAHGNVLSSETPVTIDGMSTTAVDTSVYDGDDNETSSTDPDGLITTTEYAGDNPTRSVIDPGGLALTSTFAYDGRGNPTVARDAFGRGLDLTYDALGNPLELSDQSGAVTEIESNSRGDVTRGEDPLGTVTTLSRDRAGNLVREDVFAPGGTLLRRRDYTYDANGNRLTDTLHRTIDGTLRALTTTFGYDAANRVISIIDPTGNESRIEYDGLGREKARIDALGRRTTFTYDDVGNLVDTEYPDGTHETATYDALGQVVGRSDRAGRATALEIDELGRVVATTYPDGSTERQIYSPGGLVETEIDGNGNRTDFEYDAAGRRTRTVQPEVFDAALGGNVRPTIVEERNAAGALAALVDADGKRTTFDYDAAGRIETTRFADADRRPRTDDDPAFRRAQSPDRAALARRAVRDPRLRRDRTPHHGHRRQRPPDDVRLRRRRPDQQAHLPRRIGRRLHVHADRAAGNRHRRARHDGVPVRCARSAHRGHPPERRGRPLRL